MTYEKFISETKKIMNNTEMIRVEDNILSFKKVPFIFDEVKPLKDFWLYQNYFSINRCINNRFLLIEQYQKRFADPDAVVKMQEEWKKEHMVQNDNGKYMYDAELPWYLNEKFSVEDVVQYFIVDDMWLDLKTGLLFLDTDWRPAFYDSTIKFPDELIEEAVELQYSDYGKAFENDEHIIILDLDTYDLLDDYINYLPDKIDQLINENKYCNYDLNAVLDAADSISVSIRTIDNEQSIEL